MADGRVLLEVVVEGKNVKVVQREVEQVTNAVNQNTGAQRRNKKATDEATGSHAHYDRGLKGVHQSNLSASKGFSKMRDAMAGSSGLVGAYATLAANLFAATAAFAALQKAAQVEQLTQGLLALGQASGVAMISLSRDLQEATGYAVSLQDSMRSVALITSSGFDSSYVERLGTVAKNTSVALGRDLQDSLDRLVRGATKLEPELLDELGIMVRLDEASEKYAIRIGKTASQLTNFEKRQAFMNAILEEGESKFGAIGDSVDPNPYNKLNATLQELSATVLNAFNVILAPIAGFLADSKLALAGLIAVLSKGIINQALPVLSEMADATARLAKQTSKEAEAAKNAAGVEINARKAALPALEATLGKRGESIDLAMQEASSLKEFVKVQSTVNRSISAREALDRKTPGSQTEQLEALRAYKKELDDVIRLETKREALASGSKALKAKTTFFVRGAERLESLDEDSSFKNYREQFKGALEDAKNLRKELKEQGEESSFFGDTLVGIGEKAQQFGASLGQAGSAGQIFSSVMTYMRVAIDRARTAISAFAVSLTTTLKSAFMSAASGAKSFAMAIISSGSVVKGFGLIISKIGLGIRGLGAALTSGAIAWTSFGTAAKIAIKGIFYAVPIIGQLLLLWDLLSSGISYVYDLFRSDESKKFSEKIDQVTQSTAELAKNSEEVNNALSGNSRKITTQTALISAQSQIVSKVVDDFVDLRVSAEAAGEGYSDLIENSAKNISNNKLLQAELSKTTGGYTDLAEYLDESGLKGKAAADFIETLLKSTEKTTASQVAFAASLKESNQAFSQFLNSLKPKTQYTDVISGLSNIQKALDSLNGSANSFEIGKAISENLSEDSIKFFGISEMDKNLRDATSASEKFAKGLTEIKASDNIEDINKVLSSLGVGDVSSQEDAIKAVEKIQGKLNERIKEQGIEMGKNIEKYAPLLKESEALEQSQALLAKEIELVGLKQNNSVAGNIKLLKERIVLEEAANRLAILQSQNQIDIKQRSLDAETDSSVIAVLEAEIFLLKEKKKIQEDSLIVNKSREPIRIQEETIKGLSETISLNKEIISQMQARISANKEILDAEQNLLETRNKLANLRAGGTGEESAQQKFERISGQNLDKRISIIRQEAAIKRQIIDMESKLIQAQLILAQLKLEELVKQKDLNSTQRELAKQGLDLLREYTSQGSAEATRAAQIAAASAREQADIAGERYKVEEAGRAAQIENELKVLSFTEQKISMELDAAQKLLDLQSRSISDRNSILEDERRIRENNLKAQNLRNLGIQEYALTTEQVVALEKEFADKKRILILEEAAIRENSIKLEFKLLEAQLRLQKAQAQISVRQLAATPGANSEDIKQLESLIDSAYGDAISLIPQATQNSLEAARSGTEAQLSDLAATVTEAGSQLFLAANKSTATFEAVFTNIGRKFQQDIENTASIVESLSASFVSAVDSATNAFVDAIVEGKNVFESLKNAVRDTLRESLAEAAKSQLKLGIKLSLGNLLPKTESEKTLAATERLLETTKATNEKINGKEVGLPRIVELLGLIEQNTRNCCLSGSNGSDNMLGSAGADILSTISDISKPSQETSVPEEYSGIDEMVVTAKRSESIFGKIFGSIKGLLSETQEGNAAQSEGFSLLSSSLGSLAGSLLASVGPGVGKTGGMIGGTLMNAGLASGNMWLAGAGAVASFLGFAKGGVMSSSGPMPLQKYARGGIASSPQLAMFGEGSKPEAYVPLPDGRTIPVTMSSGSANVNNISVNVAVEGGQAQAQTTGGADNTEEYSRRLGVAITNAVKQEIFNQQRPGGLLYKGRR